MTQTAWAHLPNAKHIDWVLASLKANPEKWEAARTAARDAAGMATWNARCGKPWYMAYFATINAACDATFDTGGSAAYFSVIDAILALMAYDDCGYMIESEIGELKIIAAFGDPRAILLLPACIAFNETKVLTTDSFAV